MPNLLTKQALTAAACAAAVYICENGGQALQHKPVTKAIACAVATVCAAVVTVETAKVAKKAVEEALPVVGKTIQRVGRDLRLRPGN